MCSRLNGCYECLNNGKASEGLLDLTGGLTEVYYPSKMQGPELFTVIRLALKNGAFLSCNTVSIFTNSHNMCCVIITEYFDAYCIIQYCTKAY